MNRGAWQATVHRVTQSQTQLKWLSMQRTRSEEILEDHLISNKMKRVVRNELALGTIFFEGGGQGRGEWQWEIKMYCIFISAGKMREEAQGWAEKQGHRDSDQGADQKEEIITSHMVSWRLRGGGVRLGGFFNLFLLDLLPSYPGTAVWNHHHPNPPSWYLPHPPWCHPVAFYQRTESPTAVSRTSR